MEIYGKDHYILLLVEQKIKVDKTSLVYVNFDNALGLIAQRKRVENIATIKGFIKNMTSSS